jgi:peroxiredoxin
LERVRHCCSTNLLEAILKNNPSAEVRATACFSLAALWKAGARFGLNSKATAEAGRYFERVTTEFARLGPAGAELVRKANSELHELRHLIIGKPAPATEGQDLDGQKINLNDYRGKVVVLVFWCCGYSEALELRKLLEQMSEKPVALLGISGDNKLDRAKADAEKYQVSWPSIWDGQDQPIHKAWNVNKWLTTSLLFNKLLNVKSSKSFSFSSGCAGRKGITLPPPRRMTVDRRTFSWTLLLSRLGVDPAIASGPFVTTVTDVIGFFAFLGIATLWFGLK